jgi:hypothetical protein
MPNLVKLLRSVAVSKEDDIIRDPGGDHMLRFTTTFVVLTFAATLAGAQPQADTVAKLDTIAQHLTRIGRAHGEAIWPGFRPDTIPVAFVFPTQGTALFGWRGILPEGYAPVTGIRNGAWRDQRALGAASTGAAIAGRPVAQVVVSSLDPAVLLPVAVHEAFHVFEAASVKPARRFGRGENAFYVSSYPVFDADNEMMFAREGELLEQALRARSVRGKRDRARQFVAVRRARHRRLDDSFAQFDRASEMNEGLAQYAQVRALDLMTGDQQLPAEWRVSAWKRLTEEDERLANLTGNVAQSFRLRFYSTGPGQARLLDAIGGAGWKQTMMERNETLQDALARATGMNTVEDQALALATRAGDTSRVGVSARAAVARLKALRAAQVDSVLSRPGILLVLSAAELPGKDVGNCGFDPQNLLQVSSTVQLHTRWWRPCSGKALVSEFNLPSVHDDKDGTIRAVIGAETDVKITVAGQSVTLADGQKINEATDVRVQAPRASVQSARANVARTGMTIRITPLP